MWGPDIPVIPPQEALRQFLIVAGCFVAAGLFMRTFLVPDRPAIPREYPFNGLEKELGGNRVRSLVCIMIHILTLGRPTLRPKVARNDDAYFVPVNYATKENKVRPNQNKTVAM